MSVGSLSIPLQRALDVSQAAGEEPGAVFPARAILQGILPAGSCPLAVLCQVPGHALGKQGSRLDPSERPGMLCGPQSTALQLCAAILGSQLGILHEAGHSNCSETPLAPVGSRNSIPGVQIPDLFFAAGSHGVGQWP